MNENESGAGAIFATDPTAKTADDGYTLLLMTPNHTINATVRNPNLAERLKRDGIEPIGSTAESFAALIAKEIV